MLTILRSKRCFAVRVHTLANVFTSVWPRPRGLWNHPICQLTSDAVHLLWLWWGSPEYCSSSLPCRLGRSHSRHLTSSFVERSEEHTSELQSRPHLVCRLLLE